jgi:hypothetical protein
MKKKMSKRNKGKEEARAPENCSICWEEFTDHKRKKIECPGCDLLVCALCVSRYLVNEISEAHCLQCKKAWDRDFLVRNVSKAFVNGKWKQHRTSLMIDREKALLPETQESAAEYKNLVKRREEFVKERNVLYDQDRQIREQLRTVNRRLNLIYHGMEDLKAGRPMRNIDDLILDDQKKVERKKFIRPCTAPNCRGFLSTAWKCGMCEQYTCPRCFEFVGPHPPRQRGEDGGEDDGDENENEDGDRHVCKEENVRSAEEIRKSTKNCPQCGVSIFKISGCSQMWCTHCHIAFDWRTGEIHVTRNVHNPHYFEFMAQRNPNQQNTINYRQVMQNNCGGMINRFSLEKYRSSKHYRHLLDAYQFINHVDQVVMRQYTPNRNDDVTYRLLRWKYIHNQIDEKQWRSSLYAIDKANEKETEIRRVLEMLVTCGREVFYKLEEWGIGSLDDLMEEMKALVEYADKAMYNISLTYDNVTPRFRYYPHEPNDSFRVYRFHHRFPVDDYELVKRRRI